MIAFMTFMTFMTLDLLNVKFLWFLYRQAIQLGYEEFWIRVCNWNSVCSETILDPRSFGARSLGSHPPPPCLSQKLLQTQSRRKSTKLTWLFFPKAGEKVIKMMELFCLDFFTFSTSSLRSMAPSSRPVRKPKMWVTTETPETRMMTLTDFVSFCP